MASVSGAHNSRSVIDIIPQFPKSKVETGSVRLRPILGVSSCVQATSSRFPKLEECAHFHYDNVELPTVQLSVVEGGTESGLVVEVKSGGESWNLVRTFDHFRKLDEQLHKCVFARSFSELPELCSEPPSRVETKRQLTLYVRRLNEALSGSCVSCGPVLTWFELDNRGRRLVASGHGINTPAVAAAFATTTYTANANDELSFQIGDMISVIDMPPAEESVWWRGKRGFVVGFFPSHCVAVITGKIPTDLTLVEPTKPVLRKHGKLIAFFRAFILSRPSRRRLKQSGILKERVFGCDLSEHLLNSAREIPLVLKCCADFIESHGIVDGIYRLSGVSSNIQKLRSTFDEDRTPSLAEESTILQDIHSVASLLKMYFRELPNPLCTYQLYDEFVNAVQSPPETRLENMVRVVKKLPPPHYRTLEYLMGHLNRVSEHSPATGMTARNVAIVWAPNLLRCKSLGVAALQGVGVQALVTEFLVLHYRLIFSNEPFLAGNGSRSKSLVVSSPTKLLSIEEAQARELQSPIKSVGTASEESSRGKDEPMTFHTVLELPRKRQPLNWRTFFTPLKAHNKTSYTKHKSVVKSAEFLGRSKGHSTQVPIDRVPSTHSRSVSHDSYFDTNLDQPSTSSLHDNTHPGLSLSLDLSELHMNFEMDESEMKIFSEDETNQLFSSGGSIAFSPLENETALEERFSNHELRYIDSYSPDPMETDPTSLGYVPLLTPSSCGDIKAEQVAKSVSESSRVSPFAYEKMVESGENSRKSDGSQYASQLGSGESSRKSDVVGYEKLESSPEGYMYEPCGTNNGTNIKSPKKEDRIIRENNLYESMEAESLPSNTYENETIVNKLKRDAGDNIYEDIQLSSTQDIYEQVSYLRSSVEEVNRMVGGKLPRGRIGPPPNKELKKSLSLERIQVNKKREGKVTPDKRFSIPILTELAHKSSAHHIYEPIAPSRDQPSDSLVDAFCDTEYENVNFSLSPPPRAPQPFKLEHLKQESQAILEEDKKSELVEQVTAKRKMSEDSGTKFSCTVVSELLKSDVKNKKSPTSEEVPKGLDLEVKGKTDKLRKFFEQDLPKGEKSPTQSTTPLVKSPSQGKLDYTQLKEQLSPVSSNKTSPPKLPSQIKSDTASQEPISPLKSNKDSTPPSKLPSHPKLDLTINKDQLPKQEVKSPIQEKFEFFQNKEQEARESQSQNTKQEVRSPSRKFELHYKSVSPSHKLSSPESPTDSELIKPVSGESEMERRERIEKYKEERRSFFRNKYKMDNMNNNDDEELIRRIKEKTRSGGSGRSDMDRRRSYESKEDDSRKPQQTSKTTVSILYSPTRTQAPSWNTLNNPEK